MSEIVPDVNSVSENKQAGASLILGGAAITLSFFNLLPGLLNTAGIVGPFAALLAIYAGVRGLIAAQKSGGQGRTMALGGLAAAVIGLVLFALLVGRSPGAKEASGQITSAAVSGAIKAGEARFQDNDFDGAIAEFDRALERDPESAAAYSYRGFAYAAKGDLEQALADFEKALTIAPDNALTYYHRGTVYVNGRQPDRAIADLDRAIELDATLFLAYNNRGIAYNQKDDLDQALSDFDRAIELGFNSAMVFTNRGSVYGKKGDLDQAIADFDRAIEMDPGYAQAYLVRGLSYLQAGNVEQAIDDWRELLRISGDPALRGQAENLLREVGANE